ncbi:hypothetical protein NC653_026199 [Populus alba x Populus x berolinensis]|nr:hypothetical protein NC653_026199 [Populus alba x Populus x berolinensis]
MEMDLSDIRMRQGKKSCTPPARKLPFNDECDQTNKISGKGKREKNLWGLFRGKASLGCIPPV